MEKLFSGWTGKIILTIIGVALALLLVQELKKKGILFTA